MIPFSKDDMRFIGLMLRTGSADERLWALAFLKEWGKLGKRIYKLHPSEKLKQSLFDLKRIIESV